MKTKTFSTYTDGLTITVNAKSKSDAVKRTANIIKKLGIDIEQDFVEDDLAASYMDNETTVEEWLRIKGVELTNSVMLVIDGDGAAADVRVYRV